MRERGVDSEVAAGKREARVSTASWLVVVFLQCGLHLAETRHRCPSLCATKTI